MATDAEISAAIAAATTLAITPAQMVALIDRAIAVGPAEDGRLVVASSSRGTAITYESLQSAIAARDYFHQLDVAANGFTSSPGEFVSG